MKLYEPPTPLMLADSALLGCRGLRIKEPLVKDCGDEIMTESDVQIPSKVARPLEHEISNTSNSSRRMLLLVLLISCSKGLATLLGICTSDSVIISSPQSLTRGSLILSHYHPTITSLYDSAPSLIAIEGDPSDCEEIVNSVRLVNEQSRLLFDKDLPLHSVALHTARLIHSRLRTSPLNCRLLIGGIDFFSRQPELYWVDDTGSLQKVKSGAHGKELSLVLGVLDEVDRKTPLSNLPVHSGVDAIKACWTGVQRRTTGNIQNIVIAYTSKSSPIVQTVEYMVSPNLSV